MWRHVVHIILSIILFILCGIIFDSTTIISIKCTLIVIGMIFPLISVGSRVLILKEYILDDKYLSYDHKLITMKFSRVKRFVQLAPKKYFFYPYYIYYKYDRTTVNGTFMKEVSIYFTGLTDYFRYWMYRLEVAKADKVNIYLEGVKEDLDRFNDKYLHELELISKKSSAELDKLQISENEDSDIKLTLDPFGDKDNKI